MTPPPAEMDVCRNGWEWQHLRAGDNENDIVSISDDKTITGRYSVHSLTAVMPRWLKARSPPSKPTTVRRLRQ
jgi:hypothetical protein